MFARNLAYTLGIPMERIRVVDVVQSGGQRRRHLLIENPELLVDFFIQPDQTETEESEEGKNILDMFAPNTSRVPFKGSVLHMRFCVGS